MTTPSQSSSRFTGYNLRIQETDYPKVRKQSSALYDMVGQTFPGSPAKKVRQQLASSMLAPDPRPLLEVACKMLQQLKNDRGNSLLHEAVLDDNRSLSRLCLKLGYQDCQNDEGETPVHVAVRVQNSVLFSKILKNNPNLLLENKQSKTACEVAAEIGYLVFVKSFLLRAETLDQLVPKARQYAFLATLWQSCYNEQIMLAARMYEPKQEKARFVWDFNQQSLPALSEWVLNPVIRASEFKFSLSANDWELLLLHFLGKKSILFARDRKHMREGSYEYRMYVAVQWTWRTFCQRQMLEPNPLWLKIDQAIARVIQKRSMAFLANCARRGQEPVIIRSGWSTHSIAVVFYQNLLFVCNRGARTDVQKHNLTAYTINQSLVTTEMLRKIDALRDGEKEACLEYLFKTLPEALKAEETNFCKIIHFECQPSDQDSPNCIVANLRTAIRAILLADAEGGGDAWRFEKPTAVYKEYALSSRYAILQQYLEGQKVGKRESFTH